MACCDKRERYSINVGWFAITNTLSIPSSVLQQLQSSLQLLASEMMDLTTRCLELAAEENIQGKGDTGIVTHLEKCVVQAEERVAERTWALGQAMTLLDNCESKGGRGRSEISKQTGYDGNYKHGCDDQN
jgi:hypothetical protein